MRRYWRKLHSVELLNPGFSDFDQTLRVGTSITLVLHPLPLIGLQGSRITRLGAGG